MLARFWIIAVVILSLVKPNYFQFFINTGRISTDEFRLIGGSTPNEGRLQISHADPPDGSWSTVCADPDTVDTTVAFAICARMGYKVACDYGISAEFDTTSPNADLRPIEEVSFTSCEIGPTPWELDCVTVWFPSSSDACSVGRQDVWLRCTSEPGDLELRMADPLSSFTGILQARCRGSQEWSSVCSGTLWDIRDADVACRHLGFSFSAESVRSISVSTLDPASVPARVFISEFGCAGNESDILQCQLGLVRTSCPTVPRISCGKVTTEYGSQVGLCGNRNLCGTECAQQLDTSGFPRSGCHCDDACMALGDCCYDYQVNCNPEARDPPTTLNGLPIGWFGCVDVPGFDTVFDGYYLVNTCPDSWLGIGVRDLCQLLADPSDVLASIPVYNNVTIVQYRNIYCAICHGEVYDQMTPWTVEARYSTDRGGQLFLNNFGVRAPASSTFTGFFVVTAPDLMQGNIRRCSVPIIDTCFEEYWGTETEQGCQGFAAAMTYRPSAFSGTITNYRNPYCGKCNNVTLTLSESCGYNFCELLCSDPLLRCFERCASGEDFLTLDVLFQFKSDGNTLQGLVSCMAGEIYDPFLGSCRLLSCSPGYEVQHEECVKVVAPSTVQPDGNKPVGASFAYNPNNTVNVGLVGCLTVLLSGNTESILYWDATMDNSSNSVALSFLVANETAIVDLNSALSGLANTTWCNATQAAFFLARVSVLPVDICWNYDVTGSSLFQEYFRQDMSSRVTRVSQYDYDSSTQTYILSEIEPACLEHNFTCPSVVTLNSTEFVKSENGNEMIVEYIPSGRILPVGTYVILADGRAVVCADILTVNPTNPESTVTELAYRYLFLVLTILSLIALAVTFIVYSMLPILRNLAGQCVMNLVVALFAANFLLLLNGFLIDVPVLCMVAAPVTHLAWLAAFMWMAVLSLNVARTITSKVVSKSKESTTRPLLLYMLFAWGTSLVIVCICIALHFCQCAGTGPIYASTSSCYIVNANVNLYAFGIPAALTLTVSICLFVFTVVFLRMSRSSTRIARNETRLQEAKVEFVIYVRLSVLMGMSWIFGFLTQVVEGYAMLFIFVILNALQGVLIFLSFCSTARIRGLLSERYRQVCRSKQRQKTKRKKAVLVDSSGTQSQTQNAHSVISDTTKV